MKKWLVLLLIFIISCSEEVVHSEGEGFDLKNECSKLDGILCKQNEFCTGEILLERCCSSSCSGVKLDFASYESKEDLASCKIVKDPCSDGDCKVIIVLDNDVVENLSQELDVWKSDIVNDLNVQVNILNYSVNVLPFQVRSDIMKSYSNKLKGVVFVGDIPAMFFGGGYQGELFPSDFYYVDLEGFCLDEFAIIPEENFSEDSIPLYTENKKFFYRGKNKECQKSSQMFLKPFWTGRISPSNDKLTALKKYFDRNHDFRTGKLVYDKKLLAYYPIVLDRMAEGSKDYKDFADFRVDELYDKSSINIIPLERDNAGRPDYEADPFDISKSAKDYLNELKNPYEFVYFDGHGFPVSHQENIDSNYVRNISPNALFYSLNSCSVGRFTASNYIAGEYLFSGNGLVAFGATTPVYGAGPQIDEGNSLSFAHGLMFGDVYRLFIQNRPAHVLGDPTLRMRATQKLNISPCVSDLFLDFGVFNAGEHVEKNVKIFNFGSDSLRILDSSIKALPSSTPEIFISPWKCEGEILPNKSLDCFFISQAPKKGVYEGFVFLITNDPQNQIIRIRFKGEVI